MSEIEVPLSQFNSLIQDIYNEQHVDLAFLKFVGSWITQMTNRQKDTGNHIFEIESHYYAECLDSLKTNNNSLNIRAIADLSDIDFNEDTENDFTEKFWIDTNETFNVTGTMEDERIFLFNWKSFFNLVELDHIYKILKKQSHFTKVRFGSAFEIREIWKNQFDEQQFSMDLLLITPDNIGGYILRNDNRFLRLEKNKNKHDKYMSLFSEVKDLTVQFTDEMNYIDIRKKWIQRNNIGVWKKSWSEINLDPEYLRYYDMNIRCWIPQYENFIEKCANMMKIEISNLLRKKDKLNILEIGFGTGTLSTNMLNWQRAINTPFENVTSVPISKYEAIDSYGNMVNYARNHYQEYSNAFSQGTFPELLIGNAASTKFDVIIGTLVFHDLLNDCENDNDLEDLLNHFNTRLNKSGVIIFGDCFYNIEQDQRQLDYWKKSMLNFGLEENQIADFFKYNTDMTDKFDRANLDLIAYKCGFEKPRLQRAVGINKLSPFKIIIIRKKEIND